MKKLISACFALALVIICLWAFSTQADATAGGTCGENLTWTLDDSGTLTISGTGPMWDYEHESHTPWYNDRSSIKTIIIEDGVTYIGKCAFYECVNMTSVTIPDSVTGIAFCAFTHNEKLTDLKLPAKLTYLGQQAFDGCSSITEIDIPGTVTFVDGGVFEDCTALVKARFHSDPDIPSFICANALFRSCTALEEIQVDEGHIALYDVDGVLYCGKVLMQYPLGRKDPDFVIPEGTEEIFSLAFEYAQYMESVTIPDSLTTIGKYAFSCCDSLESATLGNGVVTIEDGAFRWCGGLTTIAIPNSVTTIGNQAFYYCDSLESVTIPDSVTTIGNYVFGFCASLTDISIDANNSAYCSDEWGVLYNKDKTVLIQAPGGISGAYTIPDSVKTIDNHAFDSCAILESVIIGDNVETIGNYAFWHCDSLRSVNIPDSVTTIGELAFTWCRSLKTIALGDSVKTIGASAFEVCDRLTSVSIPDSVETIAESAFVSCISLSDVYYTGTEAQWGEISIGLNNECLTEATFHFNHSHDYASVTVEATCAAKGYVEYTCVCGDTFREILPKLPHSFADGFCTVCGAPEYIPGDLDDNGVVDEDDVIYLLQHLLMPEDFKVNQPVDYDKDNNVDEDDVVYLLQHLLMPDDFPL